MTTKAVKLKNIITHNTTFIDDALDHIRLPVFVGGLFITYVIYIVIALGLFTVNPGYVNMLSIGIQLFICVFLIARFHPFRHHVLRPTDAQIIFGSAIFLLTNMGITQYLYYNMSQKLKTVPIIGGIVSSVNNNLEKSKNNNTRTQYKEVPNLMPNSQSPSNI